MLEPTTASLVKPIASQHINKSKGFVYHHLNRSHHHHHHHHYHRHRHHNHQQTDCMDVPNGQLWRCCWHSWAVGLSLSVSTVIVIIIIITISGISGIVIILIAMILLLIIIIRYRVWETVVLSLDSQSLKPLTRRGKHNHRVRAYFVMNNNKKRIFDRTVLIV